MTEFAIGASAPPNQAPSPYIDRRALSDAWYDALYRRSPGHLDKGAEPHVHTTSDSGALGTALIPRVNAVSAAPAAATDVRIARAPRERAGSTAEPVLYAHDAASLQRMMRAILERASAARAAGNAPALGTLRLDIPQRDGSVVKLVVAQNATQLALVAVCPAGARAAVEGAIARLRDTLAPAGLTLAYKVHER